MHQRFYTLPVLSAVIRFLRLFIPLFDSRFLFLDKKTQKTALTHTVLMFPKGSVFPNGQKTPERLPLSGVAGGFILRLKLGQGSVLALCHDARLCVCSVS